MKEEMRVYLDEEADFLEISVGTPSNSETSEIKPGVFIRKDVKTQEIKSVGILNFKKRAKNINDIIELKLPIKIEMSLA
ncbi:MAG: hypothetical protein AABX19_04610 [Nanoarchaeota archaeon]